jgi:hypothetical protein
VKKTIYFLIIGIFIAAPYVVTAETYLKSGHPCYDIDPSNGGRDGHACWPKGEDPSVSVEASGDLGDGGAGDLVGGGPSFDDTLVGAPGSTGIDRSVKGKWEGGNTTKNAQGRAESGSAARTQQD